MKAKKSLGQHFLHDQKVLQQIVAAADLKVGDKVLEIGPGKGVLTSELVNACTDVRTYVRTSNVIAIEKDRELASQLENQNSKLKIIEGDILEVNLPLLIEQNDFFEYKVVANIPYYITGKIIRLLFETKYPPKLVVLLVQKEVAERICASPGKMSILSASVKYFGVPQIVDFVSRKSFDPVPKVDSAILRIIPHEKLSSKTETKDFFTIIKIGFSSRRKTLLNNLAAGLKMQKSTILNILEENGLSENTRAQELGIDDWKKLQKNKLFENK
jgi:16S rRNA (adenine1518-N6/adenine1519-N6)-dimethyltransferase